MGGVWDRRSVRKQRLQVACGEGAVAERAEALLARLHEAGAEDSGRPLRRADGVCNLIGWRLVPVRVLVVQVQRAERVARLVRARPQVWRTLLVET